MISSKNEKRKILLAPGPVQMPAEVLAELALPMIHHRTPEFTDLMLRVLDGLKTAFNTKNPVIPIPSTGSGAMEAAVVNSLSKGDEVVVISAGKFGNRWKEICETYGITVNLIKKNPAETLDFDQLNSLLSSKPIRAVFTQACETSTAQILPIKEISTHIKSNHPDVLFAVDAISALGAMELNMDELNIDILISGSQKSFMIPTGIAMVSFSELAWESNKKSDLPKYYFNLKKELSANEKGQTQFSSSVTLIRALDVSLKLILKDGLKENINKCEKLNKLCLLALEKFGLKVYSTSPVLTAFLSPEGIDGAKLRAHIEKEYDVTLMGGQDELKGKILRVGHIGFVQPSDMIFAMEALGKALIDFSYGGLNEDGLNKIIQELEKSI